MRRGYLSEYFVGVAAKRLSVVETDPSRSNQHEFQAVSAMLGFIGRSSEPFPFPARFIYLTDDDPDPIVEDASLTLYDSRRKNPKRSAEYRFYFADNAVTRCMAAGDLLVIAKQRDGGLLVVVAENASSISSQIEWLFGLGDLTLPGFDQSRRDPAFSVRAELENDHDRIEFASRYILESIGVEVEAADDAYLDKILSRFGDGWPDTKSFSPFARSLSADVSPIDDPDQALMVWVDKEYVLYRTLEKHLISERLSRGFAGDEGVDDFLSYSLSVQNRRKSRSGSSLENHIDELLTLNGVAFARGVKTEANSKPDFLFPSLASYADPTFPPEQLHMLASKRSAKDRWRQILAEAERIPLKHLLTLEAAISISQTDEMARHKVQLVVPLELHATFSSEQATALFAVKDFIALVR